MSGTWTTARYIKPGDYLGDVVDGLLKPTVKVTHVGRDGTVIRLTVQNAPPTSLYSFVVQEEAEFYVFTPTTTQETHHG